jgi:hypothetical protein
MATDIDLMPLLSIAGISNIVLSRAAKAGSGIPELGQTRVNRAVLLAWMVPSFHTVQ